MAKKPATYSPLCIHLLLALTTLAVYWQVRNYDFVNYDDRSYVSENHHVKAGFTRDSVVWAFTKGHSANWHPLTWLSHMLDCQLFGPDPGSHHLTTLLLHVANTLLLFGLLNRMTGALWRSAFVAAAFALHPLHVESVAWISERKDVLSTLFWFLTMAAYLRYVRRPRTTSYLLALLAFALGLMAKPMLVTLPFVLLLLDYWPLNRFQNSQVLKAAKRHRRKTDKITSQWHGPYRLIREKIPFFALAVGSCIITFLVQRRMGAMATTQHFSLAARIANSCTSYMTYIWKMIWPSRLAMFYPYPDKTYLMPQAAVSALLLLVTSLAIIRLMRTHRYLLTGWLWYLGTLVPVIGLVQVGEQAHADRYTYVPLTGLFIIIAWGVPDLLAKWRFRRITLAASAIAILLALSICTYRQQRHWRNTVTLSEHALKINEGNHVAHFTMAGYFVGKGEIDHAIDSYRQCLQIKPTYFPALSGLAAALDQQGNTEQAVKYYTDALRLKRDDAFTTNNLAWIRATHNQPRFRNPKQALQLAQQACKLTDYDNPIILDTLAAAYAADNRFPKAIETAERAVKLADSIGEEDLARQIQDRLSLYKAGRPYIEP